jgi:hypothetical protein
MERTMDMKSLVAISVALLVIFLANASAKSTLIRMLEGSTSRTANSAQTAALR